MNAKGVSTLARKINIDELREFLAEHRHLSWPNARDRAAAYFNAHPDTIRRLARENGLVKFAGAQTTLTAEQVERMKALAKNEPGIPAPWIAEDLGIDPKTVRDHLGKRPEVAPDWRPVWYAIRRNPTLLALHREFAPHPEHGATRKSVIAA